MSDKLVLGNTFTQGTRYSGNFNTDFLVRDVEDKIYLIDPSNYPLFQYLFLQKSKSVMVGNAFTKHEWGEDELVADDDTLASAGSGGSTTMTIVPNDTALFRLGTCVRFEETDETGTVTAISPNIVVTRDSGNWTSVSANTRVLLLGEGYSEIQAPTGYVKTSKAMFYNYCQIFSKLVSFSERAVMASKNGGIYGGNDWDTEMTKKGKEMKRDIENAFWFNGDAYYTASSGVVTTKTAGVLKQIEARGGFMQPYTTAITEDSWDNFLKRKTLGSNVVTAFAGYDASADLEKIVKARYSNIGMVKKYGAIENDGESLEVIPYYAFGKRIDIIRVPLWKGKYSGHVVLLDDNYVKLQHAGNDDKGSRKMRTEQLVKADGTPLKEAQFKADVGVDIINAKTCQIMYKQT
jgi:hypothetical protein